jgi:hypothetical protein
VSYDIELVDPVTREVLQLDEAHHMRGGTYCPAGTTDARLNVTYNYAPHFYRVFGDKADEKETSCFGQMFASNGSGIRRLYGMTGAQSLPVLDAAIAKLGDDVDPDYWRATEGNAKRALMQLRALAAMRPDGIWDGD